MITLTDQFLRLASPAIRNFWNTYPNLENILQTMVNSAQKAWPTVLVPVEEYLAFLARRLNQSTEPPENILSWKTEDLYLVCGCLIGIPEAIIAFEKEVFSKIEGQLRSILGSPDQLLDLKQNLLKELFFTDGKEQPKINNYTGRKGLSSWVFVVAIRKAINILRRSQKEFPLLEQDLSQLEALKEDPELQYLKILYRKEFSAAWQHALASLSCKERNLLRYAVNENLSIDQIGAIYKIHRATAARWLAQIRRKLLQNTRQTIIESLQIGPSEYESIMRLIKSQLYVSIKAHLSMDYE